jgi:glycerophosphoryl diester phosphodiesterase
MNVSRASTLLAALALCGCATPDAGRKPVPVVIAHRGASAKAPENTLAAFRRARDMGADYFELDCMLSADGAIIVIHDDTVDRTTNGKGAVASMDLAALRQLDAGSWKDGRYAGERLPTLDEALAVAGGSTGVVIEIKTGEDAAAASALELTEKVVALVRERQAQQQVIVQSFSPACCATAKRLAPDLCVALLSGAKQEEEDAWKGACRWVEEFHLDGLNLSGEGFSPERLAAVHAAGRTMAIWTVNDPDAMRALAQSGVDGIITDRPDVCLEVMRELGAR